MSKYFNRKTVTCDFTAFWNFSICFGKALSIMLFEVWLQKYIFYNYLLVTPCIQYIVPGLSNYFPAQNLSTFRKQSIQSGSRANNEGWDLFVYYEVNVSHVTDGLLFSLGTKSRGQEKITCKEWQFNQCRVRLSGTEGMADWYLILSSSTHSLLLPMSIIKAATTYISSAGREEKAVRC